MREKIKKILIWTVALTVFAVAATGATYWLWLYEQPKFQDVTVELGTDSVPVSRFLTQYARVGKVSFVTDLSGIDLNRVGETQLVMKHGNKPEAVVLRVEDTTAPEVEFLTALEVEPGYVPKAEDFVVSVSDLAETALTFRETPAAADSYEDQEMVVVVTDASGNRVEQSCTLSFRWIRSEVVLELGQTLTKADILLAPELDDALLDQSLLDTVNTSGVGTYTLVSTSGTKEAQCLVTVQDTTGPVLELQEVSVYYGKTCTLEDFVVSSADLSGEVTLRLVTEIDFEEKGVHTVTVEAEDIYGNVTSAETTLIISEDITPPVIKGLSTLNVDKNSTPDYMKGVSAKDAIDGSCKVTYDASRVDTSKAGTYYVTYRATDKSGNTASSRRKVVVRHDPADTDAMVKSIAATLSSDPEEIRDYVRNTIKYNSNWGGDDPVWYGFTNKVGNCYVHALCLQELLSEKGYTTKLIWVTGKTHYWLQIYLNGKWYHIDATPGNTHTRYSLMNDEQRYETLYSSKYGQRDWDRSKWPACG